MAATLQALAASRDRLTALTEAASSERERRNQLIVDLVDQDVDRRQIAMAGGISAKSICVALAMAG